VDARHLAAMVAAMVPAAGSASQAGNALKTIITKLFNPTRQASQLFEAMGIHLDEAAWQSSNATDRLGAVAKSYNTLSDAQKNVVTSTISTMFQGNKMDVLLKSLLDDHGYYQKALDVTADSTNYWRIANAELDTVLNSDSQRVKQAGIILQNSLVKVIQPLMPAIVGLASWLAQLAMRFRGLSPEVQKLIAFGLLFLAVLGPIARYIGSVATLFSILGRSLIWVAGLFGINAGAAGTAAAANEALAVTELEAAAAAEVNAVAQGTAAAGMGSKLAAIFPGIVGMWKAFTNAVFMQALALNIKVSTAYVSMRAKVVGVFTSMWASMTAAMAARITAMQGMLAATLVPSFVASMTNLRIALWARWAVTWSYMVAPVTLAWAKITGAVAAGYARMMASLTLGGTMSIWSAFWIRFQLFAGVAMSSVGRMVRAFAAPFAAAWAAVANLAQRAWAAARFGFVAVDWTVSSLLMGVGRAIAAPFAAAWAAVANLATRVWTTLRFAFVAVDWSVSSLLLGAARAIAAPFAAAWGLVARGALVVWGWLGTAMSAIQTAWQATLRGLAAVGGFLWANTFGAAARLGAFLWQTVLMNMRVAWMLFVAFIRTPGTLLAAFKSMGSAVIAGGRGIISILGALRTGIFAMLTSPWGLAIAAIIAVFMIFRKQIEQLWNNIKAYFTNANSGIGKAFDALPNGVKNAFLRVVAIVKSVVQAISGWMSHLNPFARHSPSLVDNVTAGMAAIRAQYGSLVQVAGSVNVAYAAINRLKAASAGLQGEAASIKLNNVLQDLAKYAPQVVPAFLQLNNVLTDLTAKADRLDSAVKAQQQTVDAWKQAVDDANDALDTQKDILDRLQKTADGYKDQIDAVNDSISRLSGTPIQGMGAMEDQIFANEMAQKRFRLEIMKLEDAGQSYDDLEQRIASLNGEIESLQGTQNDLRAAGAGSEILGFYDDQISAIEQQKKAMEGQATPIQAATKALDDLSRQADEMDLQKSLQFDPLTRQIEQAASTMKEMPFDQIISGIKNNQAALGPLQSAYDQATAAVANQQSVVDAAQAVHDDLQKTYDAEQKRLDVLKNSYDQVSGAISDVNSALSDMSAAVDQAKQKQENISPALANFNAAAGGDFTDVGGTGNIGREGIAGDQSASIDDFTAGIQDDLAKSFGGMDMFKPFKDMWNKAIKWVKDNLGPWLQPVIDFFKTIFDGIDWSAPFGKIGDAVGKIDFGKIFDKIGSILETITNLIVEVGRNIWKWLGQPFQDTVGIIWDAMKRFWDFLVGIFAGGGGGGGIFQSFLDAVDAVWKFISPILNFLIDGFLMWVHVVWSAVNGILKPALNIIMDVFENVWKVIKGFFDIIAGLFTGDWGKMWHGFVEILSGLGGLIWDAIKAIPLLLWGWIKGMFSGIIDVVKDIFGIGSPSKTFLQIGIDILTGLWNGFKAMFGFLIDFFSGLFSAIGAVIEWVWTNIVSPIIGFIIDYFKLWGSIISWLWSNVVSPVFGFIGGIFSWIWNAIISVIVGFIKAEIQAWAAIITWLWDTVISPVFGFIGDIFNWIWNSVISPVLGFIGAAFTGIGDVFKWVWENLLKPYIDFWWSLIQWVWDIILKPVFGLIGDAFSALGDVFKWVWENVIKPNIDFWWGLIQWIWDNVIKNVFTWIGDAFSALGAVFKWVWENVIKPNIDFWWGLIQWIWDNVIKKVFGWIGDAFHAVGDAFKWVWENVIKPAWDALGAGIQWVWDHVIKPVWDTLKSFLDNMGGWFQSAVDAIGRAWDQIKEKTKAPIQWVIDLVWNNGLRKLWNTINNLWGGDDIDPFTVSWATGGAPILPGYTPGRDVHKFFSPTGGMLNLSGGEAVMVPQFTKMFGSKGIDMLNAAAKRGANSLGDLLNAMAGNYADGGVIDLPGWLDTVLNFVPGGGTIKDIINSINGGHAGAGAGDLATGMIRIPVDVAKKIWDKVKEWWDGDSGGGGGSPSGTMTSGTGGGMQYERQFRAIQAVFPRAKLNSSYRPGDPGYHGSGRAADLGEAGFAGGDGRPYLADMKAWIYTHIGNIAELIYDGIGNRVADVKNNRNHTYSAPIPSQHHNHVHWAMDRFDDGGMLWPGAVGRNKGTRPERILSGAQTQAFERLVNFLDTTGVPSMDSIEGAIFRATQKVYAAEGLTGGVTVVNNGDTNVTYNFYGDLSFPNITDPNDADTFLTNLGDLAGGRR
jgi:hypothetical protein